VLLSGVLDQARLAPHRHPESLKKSIGAFALALESGKAVGKVDSRTVRSTFSAIERYTPQLRIDHLPNPFPSPHNLSWYFSACACPKDVRVFATALSAGHVRVWSVAQAADGWKVLAQVFGATSAADARDSIGLETPVAAGRLKHHYLASVESFPFSAAAADELMMSQAKVLLEQQGRGHFVELTLARRFV
jgi:hypothetical protein